MSPYQHGEVFVTDDGAETDLDLGHYERFTGRHANKQDNITTGRIYQEIIAKERRGDYPRRHGAGDPARHRRHQGLHPRRQRRLSISCWCEIGGTVGDIEGLPFFEAIRQFGQEQPRGDCIYIHLTLLPYIPTAGELKTKPTQHSVKELRSIGIQPDILLCRADREIPENERRKIALFCNVRPSAVIQALDVDSHLRRAARLSRRGPRPARCSTPSASRTRREPDLVALGRDHATASPSPEGEVTIAVVGKYTGLLGRLQVAERGAGPWRHRQQGEGQPRLDRVRDLREGRPRALSRGRARHPGARRLRRARLGGQDQGGDLRARRARCPISASASACRWRASRRRATLCGIEDASSTEFGETTRAGGRH